MYIVRWLMGHPILATWFLGAIAILLTIGNSGDKKESHTDDQHTTKEHVEIDGKMPASMEKPSSVTTALLKPNENETNSNNGQSETSKSHNNVANVTNTTEGNIDSNQSVKKAMEPSITQEIVATTKIDSTEITSRSYPEGLEIKPESSETQAKTDDKPNAVSAEKQPASKEQTENTVQADKMVESTASNAVNSSETKAISDEQASQASSTIEETPKPEEASDSASIEDLGQSSSEEMLLMAREAYWNNGLDEASQIYSQLIELEPTVIEHKGELGNVYWRQGYPEKAAKLYSEIAIPMIEQGNSERVANMIGFIGLFYPDKAAEIHQRLQTVKP